MGAAPENADSAVFDEATRWFWKLQGGAATPEDRRAFEDWRSADPRHAAAYQEAREVWDAVGELDDLRELATATDFGRRESGRFFAGGLVGAAASRRSVVYAGLAAGLALALMLPVVFYAQPAWLFPHVHATRIAETAEIALPDGSAAELAPKSRLKVAYSDAERRVYLESGEAFFDVRKGDARAFFVSSGDAEIRVTGTKFNVRQGASGVTVSVAEGHVEVRRLRNNADASAAGARLSAGEEVAAPASGDSLTDVVEAPPSAIASWRAGRLVYRGAPLREFIADANRYSEVSIVVADDGLLDLPLVASLRTDQIDAMLDGLPDILPLKIDRSRKDRIVLRPAAGASD
ncbi:FecR family protein [Hyphococcus sp.]|uniref:FecR family protein n=1 Tax=Hyphococcus sp. TaxID=2038636 RepID=UPI00207F0213|nr:MAG: peptide ABC transporter substrate-binding protein [Marinicaulis sp.]